LKAELRKGNFLSCPVDIEVHDSVGAQA
jgi:hypothetical protein